MVHRTVPGSTHCFGHSNLWALVQPGLLAVCGLYNSSLDPYLVHDRLFERNRRKVA